MIAYFILLLVPCLFSLMRIGNTHTRGYLYAVGIFYVLFIGLRDQVGADWMGYINIYQIVNSMPIMASLLVTEPAFALLNWIAEQANVGIYGVNFIVAVIFVSGLIRFAKTMPVPWLALVSVTPYLVIAVGMSGMRQAAAIGLVFHLMANWGSGTVKKVLIAIVAISFHYSAIISLLFVLYSMQISKGLKWILLSVGGLLTIYVFLKISQYEVYQHRYLVNDVVSSGAVQHVLLNAIPGLMYLLFARRWKLVLGDDPRLLVLSILSVFSILGVLLISSTAFDRLALYLSPIQMLVYGSLPVLFNKPYYSMSRMKNSWMAIYFPRLAKTRAGISQYTPPQKWPDSAVDSHPPIVFQVSLLIVFAHLFILFVWLNFANTAFAFVDYKNILFN